MQMTFCELGVHVSSSVRTLQAVWHSEALGFHTQFASSMQPVRSALGYCAGHFFWHVPWNVHAQSAATHSALVPHNAHWKTHVWLDSDQRQKLLLAQDVSVVYGHGLGMHDWLPRYHWHAWSLSHEALSVHIHGSMPQELVLLLYRQLLSASHCDAGVVGMHLRTPHEAVLEYHWHSASELQLSRAVYRYTHVSVQLSPTS
jgi:hypothetical protein